MRWTRQRARRTRPEADGEVVSFWHLDSGVKLAEATPLTTVSIKRGHRGEHEVSHKTIARGMPVESVCPVVTMLVCFVLFRTRGCGCGERPAFPAPSLLWAKRMHNSGASRRGIAELYLKLCSSLRGATASAEARRAKADSATPTVIASEAKQSISPRGRNGLLRRFAPRNDGLGSDAARNDDAGTELFGLFEN